MSEKKLNEIYIMKHKLEIVAKKEDENGIRYLCYLSKPNTGYYQPESIYIKREEMDNLINIADVDSADELNNIIVKGVLYIVQGSLLQWPHFIAIGYNDSYVILNSKARLSDKPCYKIMSYDELCAYYGDPKVIDYTKPNGNKTIVKTMNESKKEQ